MTAPLEPAAVAGLRERIRSLPQMDRLLALLEPLPRTYLVGGAVRDLLRGDESVDLDLAVEGDARAVARELAERLDGQAVVHERFGTATVRAGSLALDLAATRRERYEQPGALPLVEPAPLHDDLSRRDFTINAMAAGLRGDELGRLHDPHSGREDLSARLVRVLHERSFLDDPTRLLRAVRYAGRLRFAPEPETLALAAKAAAGGALATVSGARVRDELLDLLAEPGGIAALRRLRDIGLDAALLPWLEGAIARDRTLALASATQQAADAAGAERALAALAALGSSRRDGLDAWLADLALPREAHERVSGAVAAAPLLARELTSELRPSQVHGLLAGVPPEALALALALGAPQDVVGRYLAQRAAARLEITGRDLIAAGVAEGPAIGFALEQTLARKLDGEVSGGEAELRLALELARAWSGS